MNHERRIECAARVLINPLAEPLPKTGPITRSIESHYRMTEKSRRLHESMSVIPNPDPEGKPIVEKPKDNVSEQKQ